MAEITCPVDCASGGVPDVAFDLCTPKQKFGEVDALVFAQLGQPLTIGDAAEISTRLAAIDATKIVVVHGYGDKPASSSTPTRLSSKYSFTSPQEHAVNFTIVDNNDTNYEFVRRVNKCGGKFLMYYQSGGYLYGGENFLSGNEVDTTASEVIPQSFSELSTLPLTASWQGAMSERKLSPLA